MDARFALNVLEDLPDAVLVTDGSGVVEYINGSAQRLLGVAGADARGQPAADILQLLDGSTREPVDEPLSRMLSRAGSDQSCVFDLLVPRGSAAPIPVDVSSASLRPAADRSAGLVLVLRDASRVSACLSKLTEAVRRDEHTQLLRRGELERRLTRVLETMGDGDSHALLFMDLNQFKSVNDQAGHIAGDGVLKEVASLLRLHVRERDTLARLGGDEFGLLLEHCPIEIARVRASALHSAIANHKFNAAGHRFRIGVSIGIAAIRANGHDVRAVIGAADAACYEAKRDRSARVRISETVLT